MIWMCSTQIVMPDMSGQEWEPELQKKLKLKLQLQLELEQLPPPDACPRPSLHSSPDYSERCLLKKTTKTTITEVREVKQRKTPNSAGEFGSVYDISSQCCGDNTVRTR